MAIYRPERPRWRLAVAMLAIGLLVGLLIGLVLGSDEIDPAEAGGQIRASLASAASILEVTEVEYEESVDESGVVSETEYEGSLDALARSRAAFEDVAGGLAAVDPAKADEIERAYDELRTQMRDAAPPEDVANAIEDLSQMLTPESGAP